MSRACEIARREALKGHSWKPAVKEPRPKASQIATRPAFPCSKCGSANACEHPR